MLAAFLPVEQHRKCWLEECKSAPAPKGRARGFKRAGPGDVGRSPGRSAAQKMLVGGMQQSVALQRAAPRDVGRVPAQRAVVEFAESQSGIGRTTPAVLAVCAWDQDAKPARLTSNLPASLNRKA